MWKCLSLLKCSLMSLEEGGYASFHIKLVCAVCFLSQSPEKLLRDALQDLLGWFSYMMSTCCNYIFLFLFVSAFEEVSFVVLFSMYKYLFYVSAREFGGERWFSPVHLLFELL